MVKTSAVSQNLCGGHFSGKGIPYSVTLAQWVGNRRCYKRKIQPSERDHGNFHGEFRGCEYSGVMF